MSDIGPLMTAVVKLAEFEIDLKIELKNVTPRVYRQAILSSFNRSSSFRHRSRPPVRQLQRR